MKDIIKKIEFGFGIGSSVFVITFLMGSLACGGSEIYLSRIGGERLFVNAICDICIALGYSLASLFYMNENISLGMAVLLHIGTGTAVFLGVSFFAGWIGGSIKELAVYMLITAITVALIWTVMYRQLRNRALKMNGRIQTLNH